jgi:Skp family chaperone for outer membrane proteins
MRARVTQIQDQTRATLLARRNEVASQLHGLGPMPLPTNLSPAMQVKIQQIHQQFVAEFRADAQGTIDEYTATKTDLDRQFAALHGADVGATGLAAKQLADLQKQRSDLYAKIVTQIQDDATRIAQDRGLSIVFANVEAAAGGYDMTDEVTKDIQSMHE